jgi:Ca2+/Na+ antiporter
MMMNEKILCFFRFLATISFLAFTYYIRTQTTWALLVGIVLVFSYVIYVELALPKNVFRNNKEETSQKKMRSKNLRIVNIWKILKSPRF